MNFEIEIKKIEKLNYNVKRFVVSKPNNYIYEPGQATQISINTKEEKDNFRPFTFTSINSEDFLEFVIKEYPVEKHPEHTGMTEKLHKTKVGDSLLITQPFGKIKYKGEGVFFAGGVGITPFISIFKYLIEKKEFSGNKLFFSNSYLKDIFLKDWFESIFNKEDIHFLLTREEKEGFLTGRIDRETIKRNVQEFNQYFYVCGPPSFDSQIKETLKEFEVKDNLLVTEGW